MDHRLLTLFFFNFFILSRCACELSDDKQYVFQGFLNYLKNNDQQYGFNEVTLKNIKQLIENSYSVEIGFREGTKYVKCIGNVYEKEDGVIEVVNYDCQDDTESSTLGSLGDSLEEVVTEELVSETPEVHHPVQLDNEVQTEPVTSGEQFIAVRRDGQPCIGCASEVNPEASGVVELAQLGVNQLNRLEPSIRHSLNKVIKVERQVQVVNGVRYHLTMLIDYNSCSDTVTEGCSIAKACKVSVLDKPWAKLPDGSRYRIVVANNCTETWLFEDNGEASDNDRDRPHNFHSPTPDYSGIPNTGTLDEIIQSVRNPDAQSQPEIEKALTDEEIKNIEQQIIPNSQFTQTPENYQTVTNNVDEHRTHQIANLESQASVVSSNSINESNKPSLTSQGISEDKKKAIDDLLNFFDYAGLNQNEDASKETTRIKRSYEKELNMFNMVENFNKMRKSIDRAKYIYTLAQSIVDYLNDIDASAKNQILGSVVTAEEEIENNKHYFYIKAKVIIPCGKTKCKHKDESTKICNGVIDGSNERSPQVLNTFCFNEAEQINIGKSNVVSSDDPVLLKLANTAVKTIELESSKDNALSIIKIHNANTQKVSGTLTKITILLGQTNCSKTVAIYERGNCFVDEKLGTKLCDVEVLEKQQLKETKVSYICTDRPVEESFVSKKLDYHMNDPDVADLLQEALQYLEIQSNRNSKQKIVDVKSVSTRLLSGLLINVGFTVGYTNCKNDKNVDESRCELLRNETLRHCEIQVWQRPWLEDERQINVTCKTNDTYDSDDDLQIRKKRDVQQLLGVTNDHQRGKRQMAGGLQEQDKNDPRFKTLAEESLEKYMQVTGATEPHMVVTVDKVTTQVVSGSLTRIDFTVLKNNADVIKCFSKIWEQPWLQKKEINVTCGLTNDHQRDKRQVPGGLREQDKNDPKYKTLAEESLEKYMQVTGAMEPHMVVTVDKVTTQVVAGLLTRIDFTVLKNNADVIKCFSKIWEFQKKEINVTCGLTNDHQRDKRQVPGGLQEKDKNDPKYKTLAEESLEKYMQVTGATEPHMVVTVDKVTTQVVAGSLTRIDFTVLKNNADVIKCFSKIWEQPWLQKKEINVTCGLTNDHQRDKRQVLGGLQEQDKNDPKYKTLAEESLEKYMQVTGATEPHMVVTVDKVTTQVVAGILTRIDFTVLKNNADVIKCFSKIWEFQKKEINVTCGLTNDHQRSKRQMAGGLQEKDKNDPKYKTLAEESLEKYMQVTGATEPHMVVTVDKVTTQVVAGSLTRIDFTVLKNNADVIKCFSKIWEQPWLQKKEINVTCGLTNDHQRDKRQVLGGLQEQDKNDPKYKTLAEESLEKYMQVTGATEPHMVVTVDKVTTQVVAGLLTRIDFTVLKNNAHVIKCFSKIWEFQKKEINVTCGLTNDHQRSKRQMAGGLQEKDKNDPKYKTLAEESLEKYMQVTGATEPHMVVTVDKVTTQVVSGSLTRIDFTVLKNNADVIKCFSKIWEQPWRQKKEINVTCGLTNDHQRDKRQVPGGLQEKDKNDPKYKTLAEESLEKYMQVTGATEPHMVVTVDKVTTQVVSGSLTRIDFTVLKNNADVIKCFSKIWEQPWLQKKEINVTCGLTNDHQRHKRQVLGGLQEQDKNDPKYKTLAEESLEKYMQVTGATEPHMVVTVDKVTTQVVAGILTRIDFTVLKNNADVIKCFSKIWEQPWLQKKEINVTCGLTNDHQRDKRQVPGGLREQDKNDPKYKTLAEESLEKYMQVTGATEPHMVVTVDKVTTQVVAGILTRIDFTVLKNNADVIKCFSKIWEFQKKEINVTCGLTNDHQRDKRQVPGGLQEKDKNDPKYKALAEESLEKYMQVTGATEPHMVVTVDKVTTQVVAGSLTRIDFTVLKNNADVIKCFSKIWEQPWLQKKEINVTCGLTNDHQRSKRQLAGGLQEQDKNDPKYKTLAEESLEKYMQVTGATEPHMVVTVDKVTTQVVAGILTRIDFTVLKNNADVIKCFSKIWEFQKKEINVTCGLTNDHQRSKRQMAGGLQEKDKNDPKYKTLAEESLEKYMQVTGATEPHMVVTVDKVTTQVVAGSLTRIDFTVLKNNADVIKCFSKIWEQPWLQKKDINVTCGLTNDHQRSKRQLAGGLQEQDKNDPKYKTLAEESLEKYMQVTGATEPHMVVTVDKVTTQVVAGILTRIDFTVLKNNADVIKCFSKIWEFQKKEINVTCGLTNDHQRDKRQVPGGLREQDKNDPKYKTLAEESLEKYVQVTGATEPHMVVTVDKVTTQVVAGSLTRIDFTVLKNNADVIKCFSKIWKQPWLQKKEINVTCGLTNDHQRDKRQVPGGLREQDKNDPKYKTLAEESLEKYMQVTGATEPHMVVTVDKVTTQVVAGSLTRIDFTVLKNNADVIKCFSKIWEQPWLQKKEINVTCGLTNDHQRDKRQGFGGLREQDKNDPKYKTLAEESLEKYMQVTGATEPYSVITVDKVTRQVVQGTLTRIDFTVLKNNADVIKCFSKIWEFQKKEINVTCGLTNDHQRDKRLVPGGFRRRKREIMRKRFKNSNNNLLISEGRKSKKVGGDTEQDPSKEEYKTLADESLRKYHSLQNDKVRKKVLEVKRVVTQIVSGIIYKIDYTAVPTTCSVNVRDTTLCDRTDDKEILYCHTEIWDRPWLNKKRIDVSCIDYDVNEDNDDSRSKRSVIGGFENKNVDDDHYKRLTDIAVEKFHKLSKPEYFHKVVEINEVSERVTQGFLTIIEFSISPTTCLRKSVKDKIQNCPFQKPRATLSCLAEILERPISGLTKEDVTVTCSKRHNNVKLPKITASDSKVRERRQIRPEENEVDDDTKYQYAYQAVNSLNKRSDTANLQKLVTIHDVSSTTQMDTHVVIMYIETAYTYCLRHNHDRDLNMCDEMEGMNHRLCFVKVFPSADDELVVVKIFTICDDEPEFIPTTRLNIPELLVISLAFLERTPDVRAKLVHRGDPTVVPSLHSNDPVKMSFVVAATNCSKYVNIDVDVNTRCYIDTTIPDRLCHSSIYMIPVSKKIIHVNVNCSLLNLARSRRTLTPDNTTESLQKMVEESLEKLEMSSLHRYKQRVIKINSYSTKVTSGKVTTIDFDVGYTNCLKYEWIDDVTKCEFIEHLPRRHCISEVFERLWLNNGRKIDVTCQDDETPLEAHVEFESADIATRLAQQALKHIEAKYPHPKKQQLVRIYSLEKQVVAGIHYRMKVEVGFTDCLALSVQENCHIINDGTPNRFCRINVWLRPWTDHPPNFRVTCDYQAGATTEMYHHIQAEQLFYNFITTYKPNYVNDHTEMIKRFDIFKDNIKKIHELNTHEKGTGVYAVTRFTDLTYDEFKSKYLGLNPSLHKPNEIPTRQAKIPKMDEMPDSFDWRQLGAVTEVKDQGSCGSCWAFSVTGNIEGQWKLKTGKLLSLSEQELVDCDKLDDGCNGGYMDNAYRAIEQLGGLETEDEYPYEGEDDKCSFNKTLSKVQITGAVNISSNETDMAKWLVHNGPISIGINANAMQFYVGGVSHPWKMLCNPKNIDHGVLVVGYGEKDYPLFNKKLPYWIVKNSWGPSWGEQGYYRVYRGDGTCGVNTMASSAIV